MPGATCRKTVKDRKNETIKYFGSLLYLVSSYTLTQGIFSLMTTILLLTKIDKKNYFQKQEAHTFSPK